MSMFERILDEKLDKIFDEKLKNLHKKLESLGTNEQLDKNLASIHAKLDRLVDVAEAGNFPPTLRPS